MLANPERKDFPAFQACPETQARTEVSDYQDLMELKEQKGFPDRVVILDFRAVLDPMVNVVTREIGDSRDRRVLEVSTAICECNTSMADYKCATPFYCVHACTNYNIVL